MSRIGVGGQPGALGVRHGTGSRPAGAVEGPDASPRTSDASHFEAPRGPRGPALLPPSTQSELLHGIAGPQALARLTDPVARNHAVTQGYQALSQEMSSLLGDAAVSWVSFGAWGSAQVGQELRREDAPGGLQDVLEQVQARLRALSGVDELLLTAGLPTLSERVPRLEGDAVRAEFEGALADGNCAIYAALAGPFSRFLEAVHGEAGGRADALERLSAELPEDASMLREAFQSYQAALHGAPEEREGHLLLANDQVSLSAQAALAEPIERMLRAPVEEGVRSTLQGAVSALALEGVDVVVSLVWVCEGGVFEGAIDAAAQTYGRLYREAATGLVFRQAIPHETLGRAEAQARASLTAPSQQEAPQARFDALVTALHAAGTGREGARAATPEEVMQHLARRQQDASWFEPPQSQGAPARTGELASDDWR